MRLWTREISGNNDNITFAAWSASVQIYISIFLNWLRTFCSVCCEVYSDTSDLNKMCASCTFCQVEACQLTLHASLFENGWDELAVCRERVDGIRAGDPFQSVYHSTSFGVGLPDDTDCGQRLCRMAAPKQVQLPRLKCLGNSWAADVGTRWSMSCDAKRFGRHLLDFSVARGNRPSCVFGRSGVQRDRVRTGHIRSTCSNGWESSSDLLSAEPRMCSSSDCAK